MKTLRLFLLLIAFPLFFLSCNRDRGINFNNNQTYGIIDASVNGYGWSAMNGYASFANFSLQLYGEGPNGSSLTITVYPYNGLGSYGAPNPATIYFYDINGYEYYAVSGTVNITSDINGEVIGDFAFSGVSSSGGGSIDMYGAFDLYY